MKAKEQVEGEQTSAAATYLRAADLRAKVGALAAGREAEDAFGLAALFVVGAVVVVVVVVVVFDVVIVVASSKGRFLLGCQR